MKDADPDGVSQTTEQKGEKFMQLLGMCITSWAHVEGALFEICYDLLGISREQLAIIFFRTPALSGRIELTDELVLTIIPRALGDKGGPTQVAEWKSLKRAILDQLEIRNRLAHSPAGPVFGAPSTNWYEYFTAGDRITFQSYTHPFQEFRGKGSKKPLQIEDLQEHLTKVNTFWGKLQQFRTGILLTSLLALRSSPSPQQ